MPCLHLLKIELSISVKNKSDTFKYVNTHDAILKIDGKISDTYQNVDPVSLIVLKPNEEIYLRAEANLGIAKMHASYEATSNVIFKEKTPSKFHLIYETLGQLDKKVIFVKACIILSKKLVLLKKFISEKFSQERNVREIIELELFGEDHTLGNLLATGLQKCVYVKTAAYKKTHPFINKIIIEYKLYDDADQGPIDILIRTIEYLKKIFDNIIHQLN